MESDSVMVLFPLLPLSAAGSELFLRRDLRILSASTQTTACCPGKLERAETDVSVSHAPIRGSFAQRSVQRLMFAQRCVLDIESDIKTLYANVLKSSGKEVSAQNKDITYMFLLAAATKGLGERKTSDSTEGKDHDDHLASRKVCLMLLNVSLKVLQHIPLYES
uniref:Uncharacterized protein n=1 Tax=Brassica oleracea var. oleracea TaxID=109376 RepID=A0A0D3EA88_BRAOL